ncbi:MAG: hypothetical protein P4L35_05560, partial [Ignavibacteriaceae bacterium]|nr:hypothetical protein [Ignavibacteriaceae bacterium]
DSIAFYSDTLKPRVDDQNKITNINDRGSGREDNRFNPNSVVGGSNNSYVPPVPKKRPPLHPVLSLDTLKAALVKNEYDLGNTFFTELNRPDSAAYYYRDILDNFQGSNFDARALYALGIYYETLNDSVKADSLYNIIYNNYRTEKVVNAAAIKLNKPAVDFDFDPAKDLYADAETDMIKKNFNVSLDKFYGISAKFPKSPMAPKALFASGWILENDLKLYDSAAVIYDTLTSRYPKTVYAANVKPKLYYYKEEVERKKTALKDSLKKIEQLKLKGKDVDSLSVKNQNGDQKNPVNLNNKSMGNDSLHVPKGMMTEPLKRRNNPMAMDSLRKNNPMGTDSLKKYVPMRTDSLNNSKPVISDSLKLPPNHK